MEDKGITITTETDKQNEQPAQPTEAQSVAQLNAHDQKLYGLVDEVVALFRPRIDSGELKPWEVMEALSVAASGMVISMVPPHKVKLAEKEADSLSRYILKNLDTKSNKKKYMFVSQLLGAAKMSTYVMAHGARVMETYNTQAQNTGAEQLEKLLKENEEN